MQRREFIKACLGGATACLLPAGIARSVTAGMEQAPVSFTVCGPWENPVDVLLALCESAKAPGVEIDYDSFVVARQHCEQQRPSYVVEGDTVIEQMGSCLVPIKGSLYYECDTRDGESKIVLKRGPT